MRFFHCLPRLLRPQVFTGGKCSESSHTQTRPGAVTQNFFTRGLYWHRQGSATLPWWTHKSLLGQQPRKHYPTLTIFTFLFSWVTWLQLSSPHTSKLTSSGYLFSLACKSIKCNETPFNSETLYNGGLVVRETREFRTPVFSCPPLLSPPNTTGCDRLKPFFRKPSRYGDNFFVFRMNALIFS